MVGRLRAYIAGVAAIGFVLLCLLAANVDLDRLRAGQPEAAMLDAADLLQEVATEARAGVCGDQVRVRCDRSLPVRMAPDAVLQILGNPVDNACKYGPEDRPVWLVGEREWAQAVLAVEDHGGGVPPADRERVFDRFTRLEPGRPPAGGSRPRPPLGLDAIA
jgi:signal transduction histidine kinase